MTIKHWAWDTVRNNSRSLSESLSADYSKLVKSGRQWYEAAYKDKVTIYDMKGWESIEHFECIPILESEFQQRLTQSKICWNMEKL